MSRRITYGSVVLFTLIYVLSFVDRQIIAVLGVDIRDALQLSNFQIGLLYGPVFSFIYAFAGIPMGRLADRVSRKGMICLGLFIWSLMTFLSGFAASFAFLVSARLMVGLSQSMLSPAVHSYLADTFTPKNRATVFSLYASGIFIGVGLSFLIGGSVSLYYDWRTAIISVGIPGMVVAPFAWWYIKEPNRPYHPADKGGSVVDDLLSMLKKRAIRWHLVGFSCLACTGYTLLAFVGNVFSDLFRSPQFIPAFGWFMLGVALTVILSGRLADILARKKPEYRFVMGIVAALGGLPLYIYGLLQGDPQVAFLCVGTGVLISSSYNGVAAALLQYFVRSDQRALAGGLYLFVISIAGFGLGPPVAGWLIDHVFAGPYAVSYSLLSVMIFCGITGTFSFIQAMKSYDNDLVSEE